LYRNSLNPKPQTKSTYATNLIIDTSSVSIKGEENLSAYQDYATTTGKPVSRWFCKTCGNPIRSTTDVLPGKTILKLGIYDKIPQPEWESFVADKREWLPMQEGCVQFKKESGGEKM